VSWSAFCRIRRSPECPPPNVSRAITDLQNGRDRRRLGTRTRPLWQSEYLTVLAAGLVPVDNVHQPPRILAQLKLQFTLLVDNQLASEIENAVLLRSLSEQRSSTLRSEAVRHRFLDFSPLQLHLALDLCSLKLRNRTLCQGPEQQQRGHMRWRAFNRTCRLGKVQYVEIRASASLLPSRSKAGPAWRKLRQRGLYLIGVPPSTGQDHRGKRSPAS
jgi:hypothetical protein